MTNIIDEEFMKVFTEITGAEFVDMTFPDAITGKVEMCVFCDTEKIKSTVIDYGNCLVFEPLNPVVKGHLLVIPKTHTPSFTDNADISGEVMRVASLVAGERGGDYNLITSKGKSATQSINHLHIHLVPRAENDGLILPWTNTPT